MEDVYFERIAGVGERKGAAPRQPQAAAPVKPVGPPVLNMALDDDEPAVDYAAEAAPQAVPQGDVACDENGFPVSPLRDKEDLWFVQAAALYRPLAKGVSTARTSGMFLIISGILGLVAGALSMDMVAVVVGLIVATLGTMERGAANDLAQAKRSAPLRLAINQVILLVLVIGSAWMTVQSVKAEAAQAMTMSEQEIAELPDAVQGMARQMGDTGTDLIFMMFTAVVLMSLLFQGGMALYYFTRRSKVRDFHDELPPWVSDIVTTVAAR
jgi:hypothetical protein